MTEKEKAEKLYNDILKPYREIITNLEQSNRELVEALTIAHYYINVVGENSKKDYDFVKSILSKHTAPAGQKGGDSMKYFFSRIGGADFHIHYFHRISICII